MFKLAARVGCRLWFWDDEGLPGEVFELPMLHKNNVKYAQIRDKYPPDPHAAHKSWIIGKLKGYNSYRTVAKIASRPTRRSKHQ